MERPKIGLALGSGGARGFSHLGVIKVLSDNGIGIDYIAGSSMGAFVGSLYGAGQKIEHLYQLANTFKRKYFLDFTVPKMGFIQGERVKDYIKLFTYNKNLEEFEIPTRVVATNINTGEKKVFHEGSASVAVRASIAVPGVFVPQEINNQLYVDGGVVDRVPVSVVKEMGADIIIAVDCSRFVANTNVQSIYDVMLQTIDVMQDKRVSKIDIDTDIILRPNVSHYSLSAFTNVMEIVYEGEKEAENNIKLIVDCIEKWKEKYNEI